MGDDRPDPAAGGADPEPSRFKRRDDAGRSGDLGASGHAVEVDEARDRLDHDDEASADPRGDRPVNDALAKGGELGRTAADKTGELKRTAATRGSELGRTAAGKTGEFGRVAATKSAEIGRNMSRLDVPWARGRSAGLVRAGIFGLALGPLIDYYTRSHARGHEHLKGLESPVVFVANHSSHLDAPTILRALPAEWRRRTAVAAAADYFYKKRAIANLFALIFNTVPLARRGGGIGKGSIDHVDKLIDQRWNLLMFPEGTRSRDGSIGKLRSGAAVIAAHHGIPIVPIYVHGTHDAMPPGRNWPRRIPGRLGSRRHRVEIHFGDPIRPVDADHRDEVMKLVRAFFESEAGIPGAAQAPSSGREPQAPVA